MTTPYDTALRIAERRLDQLRARIGQAVDDLQRTEAAHSNNDAVLARESMVAAGDPRLTSDSFFRQTRERRERLAAERVQAQDRLEELRLKAIEQYGSRTAVETAAAGYRADAERSAAAADQSAIDDLIGALAARRARTQRRSTAGSPP
ncbi:hypothetical protein [Sphingomonas sp.]|jgi:hypothetical protein|uniref:hypothetical protein n=1 Tax=Sphingomonas sp. TaxID=28214 RepID=UPI002ED932CD